MDNEPDEIKGSYDHGYAAGRAEGAAENERLRAALTEIRDRAALMPNGGSWACGIATITLASIDQQTTKTE